MTVEELLEALIDDYVEWAQYARENLPEEDSGRFFTLVTAAELATGRDETLAARWVERRIDEKLSAIRHNNGEE